MTAPNRSRRTRRGALLLGALLILSSCGVEAGEREASSVRTNNDSVVGSDVEDTTTTAPTTTAPPPPTDVDITGSDGSEVNDVIGNAITDLEEFWTDAYPEAYDADYEPLSGGLYAIDSSTDATDIP